MRHCAEIGDEMVCGRVAGILVISHETMKLCSCSVFDLPAADEIDVPDVPARVLRGRLIHV
jgi:hypothetical protein